MQRFFSLPLLAVLGLVAVMPARADLIGLYQFNDALNLGKDTSGHNNNAVNTGGTFTATGFQDGGLVLNGSSFLRSPINASVTVLPQFTWGVWVRPTTTNSSQTLLSADNGGFDRDLTIDNRGGSLSYSAFTGSGVLGSGTAPSTSAFTFVAGVYNQATNSLTLYVNAQSFTTTSSFGASQAFFDIGHNPGSGEFLNGTVDNVFVYNQALTAGEIDTIRTNGFPVTATTPEPGSVALIVGMGLSSAGILLRHRKSVRKARQ